MRLTRSLRLRASKDFARLLRSRCRQHGRWFVVTAVPNGLDHARLGLAISRRAASRAHDRNRLKRLVRESFRHNASLIPGLDVLVTARPEARLQPSGALLAVLADQWPKLTPCRQSSSPSSGSTAS